MRCKRTTSPRPTSHLISSLSSRRIPIVQNIKTEGCLLPSFLDLEDYQIIKFTVPFLGAVRPALFAGGLSQALPYQLPYLVPVTNRV